MSRNDWLELVALAVLALGGAALVRGVAALSAPLAWMLAGALLMLAGAVAASVANGGEK